MPLEMVEHRQRHFLPAAGHDLFLPLYDPLVSLLGGDRARKKLIDQAGIEPGRRVLDVGCGTGTLLLLLKRRYPTLQTVGLDPDPNALRRAGNKARRTGVELQLDQGFGDALLLETALSIACFLRSCFIISTKRIAKTHCGKWLGS